MHLSSFNQYLQNCPAADYTLVHNTFSGAYVVLESEEVERLRAIDAAGAAEIKAEDVAADLADRNVGILVDDLAAEERAFRAWFESRRDRPVLQVVVGINLACNFSCTYCSQQDVLDGSVMPWDTACATADWLATRALHKNVERVELSFVGGEPLLHPERILRVVELARESLRDTPVTVGFSITTNGFFVTNDLVRRLVLAGLEHVKVTLDGNESMHNQTRVAKNGRHTFRRIFDRAVAASRYVRVSINGNYQPSTVGGFRPLITDLAAAGLPKGTALSFSPALASFGRSGQPGGLACTWGRSDLAHHVALHDAAVAAGFDAGVLGVVGPCEFHELDSFAIGPTGLVYKCPGFLGQPSWAIGHVATGLTGRYSEMLALTPKSAPCGGCSDRPNCGGGCVAAEWIRSGSTDGVNCEKDYFDAMRPHSLPRGLAVALGDDAAPALPAFDLKPLGERPEDHPPSIRPASLRLI